MTPLECGGLVIDGEPTAVCPDPVNGGVLVFGYGWDQRLGKDMPLLFRKLPGDESWQPIRNRQLLAPLAGLNSQGAVLISTPDSIYLSVPDQSASKTLFRLSRCGSRVSKSLRATVYNMCLHNDLLYIVAQAKLEVRDRFSLECVRSIRYPQSFSGEGIAVVERPAPVGGGERIFLACWGHDP